MCEKLSSFHPRFEIFYHQLCKDPKKFSEYSQMWLSFYKKYGDIDFFSEEHHELLRSFMMEMTTYKAEIDKHELQLHKLSIGLVHTKDKVDELKESMATKDDIRNVIDLIEGYMQKSVTNEQEIVMMGSRVERVEKKVTQHHPE